MMNPLAQDKRAIPMEMHENAFPVRMDIQPQIASRLLLHNGNEFRDLSVQAGKVNRHYVDLTDRSGTWKFGQVP